MKKQVLLVVLLSTLLGAHSAYSAIGPVDKVLENPTFVCTSNNGDKLKITHEAGSVAVIELFIGTEIKVIKTGYTAEISKLYSQFAYAMFHPNSVQIYEHGLVGRGGGVISKEINAFVTIDDYEKHFNCK